MEVEITASESKALRALFGRKRQKASGGSAEPVAPASSEREHGAASSETGASSGNEGKRPARCPPCADADAEQDPKKQCSAKHASSSRAQAASVKKDLEAGSVQMLVLDQAIPKKTKDGEARLFGKTANGNSVCVWVSGFEPYFFFPAPRTEDGTPLTDALIEDLRCAVNEKCAKNADKSGSNAVKAISIEDRVEAMYYRASSRPFLRVRLAAQEKMKKVIDVLSAMAASGAPSASASAGKYEGTRLQWPQGCEAWETNVSAQLRFFSELAMSGGSWLQVPARPTTKHANKTRCALELECDFRELVSLTHDVADSIFPASCPPGKEHSLETLAPLKVMSLTVTAIPPLPKERTTPKKAAGGGRGAGEGAPTWSQGVATVMTPTSDKDPLGIIACSVGDAYDTSSSSTTVFVVAPASAGAPPVGRAGVPCLEGADVRYLGCERECLVAWLAWVVEQDCDCWATFEAQHSLGYLEERARKLGLTLDCGRVVGAHTCLSSVQSYGKSWAAQGRQKIKKVVPCFCGRVVGAHTCLSSVQSYGKSWAAQGRHKKNKKIKKR